MKRGKNYSVTKNVKNDKVKKLILMKNYLIQDENAKRTLKKKSFLKLKVAAQKSCRESSAPKVMSHQNA